MAEAKLNWTVLIPAALTAAEAYGTAIESMKGLARGWDAERVRAKILPLVAAHYGATIITAERGSRAGEKTIDRSDAAGTNASRALSRLIADIVGKKSASAEFEFKRGEKGAARAFVEAVGGLARARAILRAME